MKKWMNYVMVLGLMAGTASAAWWPFGGDKKDEVAPVVVPETPVVNKGKAHPLTPEQMEKVKALREAGEQNRPKRMPEQMEKMKARHEAMMKLGEAARNETDPAKKEALISEIRVKITEMVDKALADQKQRIEKAEGELPKLKQRLEDAEKNKATRIEELVQRIVSGQPMQKREGAPGTERKKGKKAPVE